MAKWKLTRQTYGSEQFIITEGDEITIGRGTNNTITLTSLVVSRQHCIINVYRDTVTVKDLKSSNGTYVAGEKILPNTLVTIHDSDLIGIGWCNIAAVENIGDNEKFMFKLEKTEKSIRDRIAFQNESDVEFTDIGLKSENLVNLRNGHNNDTKSNLKRKLSYSNAKVDPITIDSNIAKSESKENDCVILVSDSDGEKQQYKGQDEVDTYAKKCKLEPIQEIINDNPVVKKEVKCEPNSNLDYDAFRVKEEYLSYEDEPITLDSDSESESERWLLRLSQSSPGKALLSPRKNMTAQTNKDSIYSDHNDSLLKNQEEEEEFSDDMIKIPDLDPNDHEEPLVAKSSNNILQDIDEVDNGAKAGQGISSDFFANQLKCRIFVAKGQEALPSPLTPSPKKAIRIEPSVSSKQYTEKSNYKSKKSRKSPKKILISNSLKEERKRKLKEIATKEKETTDKQGLDAGPNATREIIVKKTSSNRGAFLAEATKPDRSIKKPDKEETKKHHKENDKKDKNSSKHKDKDSKHKSKNNILEKESKTKKDNDEKSKVKKSDLKPRESRSSSKEELPSKKLDDYKIPVKDLKPKLPKIQNEEEFQDDIIPNKAVKLFNKSVDSQSGKPSSKVGPFEPKKTVTFSEEPPQVRLFEIEPGNQMKKTSLVKATQVDVPQMPAFSLERISLMRILRWNPHWLDEQVNNNEPPPILGHNEALSILHFFKNHTQYVQVVGDLLLMEIWECITQAHIRKRGQNILEMKIESLPNVPSERAFEIIPLSVNYSVLKTHIKSVPRIGELMVVTFGAENMRNHRFFYVSNVRCLPSPPTNKNAFFSISLHTVYTDKMKGLRRGEMILGKSLAYIKNELMLFEAMEYLARSPLLDAILRPDPRHFIKYNNLAKENLQSQWTATLNGRQLEAVSSSVAAAFSERPSIQMIQGPPGTGKSSVICSTVMTYYYDMSGKRRNRNLGKILICATSNAAVDELVIRLLNIRQSLPKSERFRMVRVGRPEAMHPRARELSSQTLAQRDAARCQESAVTPHLEELGRLEARLNMWKSTAQEAKDPGRIAYCQGKISQVVDRIAQLRGGASPSGELSSEQLLNAERRIIEGADIVVTTLASAANQKMRGLKRRIALCIVDEAAQAIEPETLIPLTLDVTTLALIGDPQQLPGFICSQRAKKYGLGESLFARLSSSMEHWDAGSPVILLDVQYRMHPQIADYPNRAFYGGKVKTSVLTLTDLPFPAYSVVCISSGDKGQDAAGGNEMEAWGAARVALSLCACTRARGLSLALVTPYQGHRDLLRHALALLQNKDEPPIEVNTVDSFQGQERDVIVVSLARSQGVGFLTDAGRVNVMLTRAKHSLVVCLNPNALLKNPQWRTLIEDAQNRNAYKFLPNHLCQPATANTLPMNDDVLKLLCK